MAITVAQVLEFVNEAFNPSAAAWVESDIDVALKMALQEMSNNQLLVAKTAGTDTVSSGDNTITPASSLNFLDVKVLQFTSSGGTKYEPCERITDGMRGWRSSQALDTTNGTPLTFTVFDKVIYFHRTANGTYTYQLDYYKNHEWVTSGDITIEFDDEFLQCVQYGTCYHKALMRRNNAYLALYGPLFQAEMLKFKDIV